MKVILEHVGGSDPTLIVAEMAAAARASIFVPDLLVSMLAVELLGGTLNGKDVYASRYEGLARQLKADIAAAVKRMEDAFD